MSYGNTYVDGVKYGVDLWKIARIRKKRKREPNSKSAAITKAIKKILQKEDSKLNDFFIAQIFISISNN